MTKDSDNDPPSIFLPRLDEADGPALPLSEREEQQRVRAALIACGLSGVNTPKPITFDMLPELPDASHQSGSYLISQDPTQDATMRSGASRSPWGKRHLKTAIVVAVVASSSAAAALSANWRDITSWFAPGENTVASSPSPIPPQPTHVDSVVKDDPKPAPSETEPAAMVEPVVETAPTAKRPHAAKVVSGPSVPEDTEATKAAAAPQAEDLLGAANALRAQRRYAEALARYLEVVRKHPGSPQAAAARVSAATLRLEHDNDADGALELLEGAPRERNAIPEAEYLLAESYRAQGRNSQESQALRRFLLENPDHPLASKARRRLEILKREPTEAHR